MPARFQKAVQFIVRSGNVQDNISPLSIFFPKKLKKNAVVSGFKKKPRIPVSDQIEAVATFKLRRRPFFLVSAYNDSTFRIYRM